MITSALVSYFTPQFSPTAENVPVNDVLIHPNQGELISADQNGNIKQWVLSTNECDLELVQAMQIIFH